MIAFVLSGGGNRGALQVGALQVLFEHGIRPDMLVGSSAGALNAAFLAVDPSLTRTQELAEMWQMAANADIYPGRRLTVLWRLLRGQDSLFPNDNLRRFIEAHTPPGVERFADITAVRLYIVATRLDTGALRLFGEDPEERLLDALMASTALPPFHPPWPCDGELYIDGGAVADLPLSVALDKGAREIYALHVVGAEHRGQQVRGLFNIAAQALAALLRQQLANELQEIAAHREVRLHHIQLMAYQELPLWDFSHAAEMIVEGRRVMKQYLQQRSAHRADIAGDGALWSRLFIGPLRRGRGWVKRLLGKDGQETKPGVLFTELKR